MNELEKETVVGLLLDEFAEVEVGKMDLTVTDVPEGIPLGLACSLLGDSFLAPAASFVEEADGVFLLLTTTSFFLVMVV